MYVPKASSSASFAADDLNEAYRILRPGGQLVFICDRDHLDKISQIFPERIVGGDSAGSKLKKSKRISEQKQKVVEIAGTSKISKRKKLIVEAELLKTSGEAKTDSTSEKSESSEKVSRPGIISCETNTLPWKTVFAGIAVKP